MKDASSGPARRQARSIRNDGRILDAASLILAEQGWTGLSFSLVAERAGLSMRPVRDRFTDRSELAAAVWNERIFPDLKADVLAVQEACDLVIKAGSQEADALVHALAPFARPEPRMRAAIELIIVASYEPIIRGALDSALLPTLRRWVTPGLEASSPAVAAKRAYVLTTALGMVITALQLGSDFADLDDEVRHLASALAQPGEPLAQPSDTADHLDFGSGFGTGEPEWDALLQATLDQVGTRGFDAATTVAISRACGHTEGFLFSRYPSKLDLFFDATQRLIGRNTGANVEYQQHIADRYSVGMAEAVVMREFMRPGRERLRVINLEQYRLSWHDARFSGMMIDLLGPFLDAVSTTVSDPEVGRAMARIELVRGVGPVVLSVALPDTWDLPYDVVTIPLLDQRA